MTSMWWLAIQSSLVVYYAIIGWHTFALFFLLMWLVELIGPDVMLSLNEQ